MKVFLAAPVGFMDFLVQHKAPNVLMAFSSIVNAKFEPRSSVMDQLRRAHEAGITLMLDSGAAPIMAVAQSNGSSFEADAIGQYRGGGEVAVAAYQDLDRYFEAYKAFVEENAYLFDWGIVELDLQALKGDDVVLAWREDLARIVGKDHLWVVHHGEPISAFDGWPLVGVGGAGQVISTGVMRARTLKEAGHKVHGFAYMVSSKAEAKRSPFDSVDSTTWAGAKFGKVFRYERGSIITYPAGEIPPEVAVRLARYTGIPTSAWYADRLPSSNKIHYWNLMEWIKFQKAVEGKLKGGGMLGNRNHLKHGASAKSLPALTCGLCPWRDSCPMAGDDDQPCAYNKAIQKAKRKLAKIKKDPGNSYTHLLSMIADQIADIQERLARVEISEIFGESGAYPSQMRVRLYGELRQWMKLLSDLTVGEITRVPETPQDEIVFVTMRGNVSVAEPQVPGKRKKGGKDDDSQGGTA